MKRLLSTIIILTLAGCSLSTGESNESLPVTLEVYNSLRIPAHRVKISLQENASLSLELQDMKRETRHSAHILEEIEVKRIENILNRIDWKHIRNDDVRGLDGASVIVTYMGETYSVWTPSYNTEDRELEEYVSLMNSLYSLAGLTSSGLPKEPKEN